MNIFRRILAFCMLGSVISAFTQPLPSIHISLITDEFESAEGTDRLSFTKSIEHEINILLENRYDPIFHYAYGGFDAEKIQQYIQKAFLDDQIDLVIASGSLSGTFLADRKQFPKPSISAIVIDHNIQNVPQTDSGTSGAHNFTYIETPFNVARDLEVMRTIYPYKHLGIISPQQTLGNVDILPQFFEKALDDKDVDLSFIKLEATGKATADGIPDEVDAIYFLPEFSLISQAELDSLIQMINKKQLVSSALLGDLLVSRGVLIGYQVSENLNSIPRRVATDVYKILKGENAADLPVEMENFSETVLINMQTANTVKKYPDFDMMSEALLVDFEEPNTKNIYSLNGVIAQVLEQNLDIAVAEKSVGLAQKDYQTAVSNLLPEISANTSFTGVDAQTASTSFGVQGRVGWLAGGSLSQVFFSEPVYANIKINKLLRESEKFALKETQLNAVLDASQAYLNVLLAKRNLRIQRENVLLTQENYDIANNKEAVGYTGASDLNRWISELANANINLNNAFAQKRQAEFQLNQLLNLPINQPFRTDSVDLEEPILLITDERIVEFVNDYGDLEVFGDFMVDEAFRLLPELKQIQLSIAAQERQKQSQQRAFFLPSMIISGNVNYNVEQFKTFPVSPELQQFGLVPDLSKPTWNVGIGIQYPLIQGGRRSIDVQRTKVSLLQLEDSRQNARNQLELRVRSSLESVGASYATVTLSQKAATAARENFRIVQDAYSQGQVNITSLIDAQNATLQAELSRANAIFQFISDFLALERSVGFFYFLASPVEREAYFDRLVSYLNR